MYDVVLKELNGQDKIIWLISRVTDILRPNFKAKVQVYVLRKRLVSRFSNLSEAIKTF